MGCRIHICDLGGVARLLESWHLWDVCCFALFWGSRTFYSEKWPFSTSGNFFRRIWFVSGRSSCRFFHMGKTQPPWKLTWQWKINHLNMYSLLKMGIFHCHETPQVLPKHPRSHHEQQDLGGWRDGGSGVQRVFCFGVGKKSKLWKSAFPWGWYFVCVF